jgi:putative NADH-flavin reductase
MVLSSEPNFASVNSLEMESNQKSTGSEIRSIAIVGAGGSTGAAVVVQALKEYRQVVAIVRDPARFKHIEGLEVRKADVLDAQSLVLAFADIDVVISCIGPTNNFKPGKLMSEGTANIILASTVIGVKRVVMMSGILQSNGKELHFFNRIAVRMLQIVYRTVVRDKVLAERSLQSSKMDWVIIRAAGLKELEKKGNYLAGPSAPISPFKPLPFADCADCLLRAVVEPQWTRKIINVGFN